MHCDCEREVRRGSERRVRRRTTGRVQSSDKGAYEQLGPSSSYARTEKGSLISKELSNQFLIV